MPALPAWKAFVIQFGRDAAGCQANFAGRVEHLSSGRRAHFESAQQLLEVLDQMLAELRAEGS